MIVIITKLDAVKRQLETAITLWFQDADPVSIHTLVAAAREILVALNKGGEPMGVDKMTTDLSEKEELKKTITKAQNFFKHGKKDPKTILHFNPENNRFYIIESVHKYREIAKENPTIMAAFILYQMISHPEDVSSPTEPNNLLINTPHIKNRLALIKEKTKFLPELAKITRETGVV